MIDDATTHDYRKANCRQGHSVALWTSTDGGHTAQLCGWGFGLDAGHFLLLSNGNGGETRYRIDAVRYFAMPADMWKADLSFAPRNATPAEAGV